MGSGQIRQLADRKNFIIGHKASYIEQRPCARNETSVSRCARNEDMK